MYQHPRHVWAGDGGDKDWTDFPPPPPHTTPPHPPRGGGAMGGDGGVGGGGGGTSFVQIFPGAPKKNPPGAGGFRQVPRGPGGPGRASGGGLKTVGAVPWGGATGKGLGRDSRIGAKKKKKKREAPGAPISPGGGPPRMGGGLFFLSTWGWTVKLGQRGAVPGRGDPKATFAARRWGGEPVIFFRGRRFFGVARFFCFRGNWGSEGIPTIFSDHPPPPKRPLGGHFSLRSLGKPPRGFCSGPNKRGERGGGGGGRADFIGGKRDFGAAGIPGDQTRGWFGSGNGTPPGTDFFSGRASIARGRVGRGGGWGVRGFAPNWATTGGEKTHFFFLTPDENPGGEWGPNTDGGGRNSASGGAEYPGPGGFSTAAQKRGLFFGGVVPLDLHDDGGPISRGHVGGREPPFLATGIFLGAGWGKKGPKS